MKIEIAARTEVGFVRTRNEDALGIWPPGTAGEVEIASGIFAVADGMGGHPGGEVASGIAISAALEMASDVAADPAARLGAVFSEVGRRIRTRGRSEARYKEMGTTLTAVVLRGGLAWVGHVGDSRLYWIRGPRQVQVTRDHTVAQDLIEAGALSPLLAEQHPSSHILTRCLGVCNEDTPDLLGDPMALEPGDRLLLASDGLVKAIDGSLIASIVAARSAADAAGGLVQAALEAGGPDNVTVIVIGMIDPGQPCEGEGTVGFDEVERLSWNP